MSVSKWRGRLKTGCGHDWPPYLCCELSHVAGRFFGFGSAPGHCVENLLPVEPLFLALDPLFEPVELGYHFHHLIAWVGQAVTHARIDDELGGHAEFLQ